MVKLDGRKCLGCQNKSLFDGKVRLKMLKDKIKIDK